MTRLHVDMEMLIHAFEDASGFATYYLDTETGDVIPITDDTHSILKRIRRTVQPAEISEDSPDLMEALEEESVPDWQRDAVLEAAAVIKASGERFIKVPAGNSQEAYRDMERFIETVENHQLRDRLWRAIQGRGAFRRFKDTLLEYPRVRDRWFAFKHERFRQRVVAWLESEGIVPDIEEETAQAETSWTADDSRDFIDYGRYFVPAREEQIATICRLIPPYQGDGEFHVLDLCCGEGLLAGAILDAFPTCTVHGYDGSPEMLAQARDTLAEYGDRFETREFDLASDEWRRPPWRPHAVVSSLAIHHLDSDGKQGLFDDVYAMLRAGGVFIIADIVRPATQRSAEVAADAWDDAVRRRALELDGTTAAFEHFQQERWNHYRYPDPADTPSRLFNQLKWLEQSGFADIDVYWMNAGHAIFGGQKPAE